MCKYRYEYFSLCNHQAFNLYEYCEKASLYPAASTDFLGQAIKEPQISSSKEKTLQTEPRESLSLKDNIAKVSISSQFWAPSDIHHPGSASKDMSSKAPKNSSPNMAADDSINILKTCYEVLERTSFDECRHQHLMEGSPGYRAISKDAFKERLRFFESAISLRSHRLSDTLNRFTYDSNKDTLYTLDQKLKRILEKADLLDCASDVDSKKPLGIL